MSKEFWTRLKYSPGLRLLLGGSGLEIGRLGTVAGGGVAIGRGPFRPASASSYVSTITSSILFVGACFALFFLSLQRLLMFISI